MKEGMRFKVLMGTLMFAGGVGLWCFLHQDRGPLPVIPKAAGGINFDKRKEALVHVGDETISSDDINWEADQYLQTLPADGEVEDAEGGGQRKQALESLREKLLEAAIERKLLVNLVRRDKAFDMAKAGRFDACAAEASQVATEKSWAAGSGEAARLKAYMCDNALIEQYFAETVYPGLTVTPEELKEHFEKNKAQYHTPEKVVVRQIVTGSEDEAKKVRAKVNAANFRALAKEMSIAPEAEKGGLLRPYAKGEMPAVFDVAFSMKVGEISAIQKSIYGFHVFFLERKIGKREADLKAFQERIRAEILEAKKKDEYRRHLELAINTIQVKRPRPLW